MDKLNYWTKWKKALNIGRPEFNSEKSTISKLQRESQARIERLKRKLQY